MLRSGDQAGAGAGRHVASCSQKEAVGLPCPAVVPGRQVQSQAPSRCPCTGLTGFSAQDRAASPPTHPSVCASAPPPPPCTGTAAPAPLGALQQLWGVSPGQAVLWTRCGEVVAVEPGSGDSRLAAASPVTSV